MFQIRGGARGKDVGPKHLNSIKLAIKRYANVSRKGKSSTGKSLQLAFRSEMTFFFIKKFVLMYYFHVLISILNSVILF